MQNQQILPSFEEGSFLWAFFIVSSLSITLAADSVLSHAMRLGVLKFNLYKVVLLKFKTLQNFSEKCQNKIKNHKMATSQDSKCHFGQVAITKIPSPRTTVFYEFV